MPPIWRPVFSTSSHTGRFAGTKATHSPHDRVDSCPHKQYDLVRWAPRQLPFILTPTGCLMMSEHANQDGSQEGQTHEDRPLKQHSPQRGKIWGGREHAGMGLPLPPSWAFKPEDSLARVPHRRSPCLEPSPATTPLPFSGIHALCSPHSLLAQPRGARLSICLCFESKTSFSLGPSDSWKSGPGLIFISHHRQLLARQIASL